MFNLEGPSKAAPVIYSDPDSDPSLLPGIRYLLTSLMHYGLRENHYVLALIIRMQIVAPQMDTGGVGGS